VSWRHRIAFVTLTVLVGLPATATICALACAPAAVVAEHHGTGKTCEQPASGSKATVSASTNDCGTHEQAVRQSPTTAATRADALATSPSVIAEMNVPLDLPREHGSIVDPTPPGPKPPKKTPPAPLRV
jgi:hypothetical protein